MKVKIYINTQLHENYGFHEGNEHWKPKGGHQFVIEGVEDDLIMYAGRRHVKDAIDAHLKANSNDLERFTYIDHEVVFSQTKIAGVDFSESLNSLARL